MSTLGTKVVIEGDSSGFRRAAAMAGKAMGDFSGKVSADLKAVAASYVSFQVFKTLIADAGKAALAIDAFSDRQHTSYEETQRLIHSYKKMGLSAEDAEAALMKLAGSRKSAAESDDDMLKTFQRFGITMSDLQDSTKSNYDLMVRMGRTMQTMEVNPTLMSDMRELFGRTGGKLINSLKDLGEGNGITLISDKTIKDMDRVEKSFERMKESWNAIAAAPIAGGLNLVANIFRKVEKVGVGGILNTVLNPMSMLLKPDEASARTMEFMKLNPDSKKPFTGLLASHQKEQIFGSPESQENAILDMVETAMAISMEDASSVFGGELLGKVMARKESMNKAPIPRAESFENKRTEKEEKAKKIDNSIKLDRGDKLSAMNIDEAQRANLGTGARAYDPMIQAQHDNTKALHALTGAIITMKTPKEVFNTDTAWT